MSLIEGQRINTAVQMGLSSMPDEVNHHKGSTPTVFTKPTDREVNYLKLHVEVGNFRSQVGDTTATIGAYATPSADVTDGTGTEALEEGEVYIFTPPDAFTVVGNDASAILTYSWV